MTSKIYSAALIGLDAHLIEVECDIGGNDFGKIVIVGLPDKAVSESCERVKSAIKNSDLYGPRLKSTVNLAPADIKKQGPAYDLPIAVSILVAAESIFTLFSIAECLFIGELSLDGKLRPVNGVLSVVLMAKARNIKRIFLPYENAQEASLIEGVEIFACQSLRDVISYLSGGKKAVKPAFNERVESDQVFKSLVDMSFIKGQEQAKRAIEIAAAGFHNILLQGPPGSGKTLIAKSIPTILPKLTLSESLEVTKIYSVSGLIKNKGKLVNARPFRTPHHTASGVALVGGGAWPQPGEISLAHRGVLFLDEFPEFPRSVLENLRQPLEDGVISICRAANKIDFPAKFMLVAAMNPCACGYVTDPKRSCSCSLNQIVGYKKRISGPLLDRIDIQIEVPCLDFKKITGKIGGDSSNIIRARVEKVRQIQEQRFAKYGILTNSEMSSNQCDVFCVLNKTSLNVLEKAMNVLNLSNRSYYRTLKVARTIADLSGSDAIMDEHISEALQYRLA